VKTTPGKRDARLLGITLDLCSHVTPSMHAQAARALDELFGRQFGRQTRTS